MRNIFIAMLCLLVTCFGAGAEDNHRNIKLPAPNKTGGMPLMDALANRESNREFAPDKELPLQTLSDLLWAANGINRAESGKRTAPTAMNWQDMQIFVFTNEAVYIYDGTNHALMLKSDGNHQKETGKQDFVEKASINLLLVSDYSKMVNATKDEKPKYAAIHAGAITQNVSLFCAANNLNTVVRCFFDEEKLRNLLMLSKDEEVIIAQSVGLKP